jgi:hypothetical protein
MIQDVTNNFYGVFYDTRVSREERSDFDDSLLLNEVSTGDIPLVVVYH